MDDSAIPDPLLGKTISHYCIETKLGEGGMGMVYKAKDLKLHRSVALKFLPPELVSDPKIRSRFEQEAIAASALNHPNICIIHEIDKVEDHHFIVMEYVRGNTLREILKKRGKLPENEVIDTFLRVCDALGTAHAKGIVHRDIKLENIMISDEGYVKIMDLGLAKLAVDVAESKTLSETESKISDVEFSKSVVFTTTIGQLMGTVSYMSPEQAQNLPVDQRTDVYSLGVTLYELLTGQHPFVRDSAADTLLEIIDKNLKAVSLQAFVSSWLRDVVLRCLEKVPDSRPDNAKEVRKLIVLGMNRNHRMKQRKRIACLLAAGFILAIVWITWKFLVPSWQSAQLSRQYGLYGKRITPVVRTEATELQPLLSPDGSLLSYTKIQHDGRSVIMIKNVESDEEIVTDEVIYGSNASWSPDGKELVYSDVRGDVAIMDRGGKFIRVLAVNAHSPKWSPDGGFVLYCRGGLAEGEEVFVIPVQGDKEERLLPSSDSLRFLDPSWSPDGKYIICNEGFGSRWHLALIDVEKRTTHKKLTNDSNLYQYPKFFPDGKLIFYLWQTAEGNRLYSKDFDIANLSLSNSENYYRTGYNIRDFSFSIDGKRVFYSTNLDRTAIVRFPFEEG